MADTDKIQNGSYKNIPIRISSGNLTGGRKKVKHEFPNRDTQTVVDMGLRPRAFTLEILTAPLTKSGVARQDYFEYRDNLLRALEDGEPGDLIHPFYGKIENVVAMTFSLDENFSNFGDSTLSVNFEVNNDTGIPKKTITSFSELTQGKNKVLGSGKSTIGKNFSVLKRYKNNFFDAKEKITDFFNTVNQAVAFVLPSPANINEFNYLLGNLAADINSLINTPNQLALAIGNVFENVNGLFATVDNTTQAFLGIFHFGGNDEQEVETTTAGRIERRNNREILNLTINTLALSYAYVNATQIEFDNVRELEEVADTLEEQYIFIIDSYTSAGGLSDAIGSLSDTLTLLSDISDMRTTVQQFLEEQKTTLKQIIEIETHRTSTRLLSYQYYGTSENSDQIIGLNGISDVSFIEGDIEVITV